MTINYLDRIEVYRACAWILNADGSPKCPTGGVLYAGEELIGAQDFTQNVPTPRIIPAVAQGTVQDTFILPAITARSATLHTLYDLFVQNANLQGVKRYTESGMDIYPLDTDAEGLEPTTALLVTGLIAHDDQGNNVWPSQFFPRAHIFPQTINAKFDATPAQFTYTITWTKALKEFWGKALTLATMGILKSGALDINTPARPNFGTWLTDGIVKDFLFDTNKPCVNAASVIAFDYATGVVMTGSPTVDTVGVHFASVPTTGKTLIAPYQF